MLKFGAKCLAEFFQKLGNQLVKITQVVFDKLADAHHVYPKILVDEQVAEAHH